MIFDTYFRATSYAMIAVAMLALLLAGGLHVGLAIGFGVLMVVAWRLERTRWQLSERVGLIVVLFSIPLFFLDWKFQQAFGEGRGRLGVTSLAHLIVFLSAIKLLQVKSDRDWVFLYLISFFEVLLAAGLSFSPVFLGTLTLYLLCALSTIIAFEIRKARQGIAHVETRLLVPPDSRVFRKLAGRSTKRNVEATRLPAVAMFLLFLIFVLALPLFLVAPRAGSAAISRGGAGFSSFIGFSESVSLGEVGTLKRNDEIVMRVRLDDAPSGIRRDLKWRGVALDEFTGRAWRKSSEARRSEQKTVERGYFRLGTTDAPQGLTTQTIFLEPIDSPVLFGAPRALAIQGDFPFIRIDAEGSIQSRPRGFDRVLYKVISDTSEPSPDQLRRDMKPYPPAYNRYREVSRSLDPRIEAYARAIVSNSRNRYDRAKAIETTLRRDYGYTLEMKAGGPDPLSDFLFNVGQGHCEYFSTAMAVMLRTQGIASRVVNGFLPGEYNEASGAYTVRQSDAHSWVEVYFPETNAWVTFDPTPEAGRIEPQRAGIVAQLGKYAEAMELLWFQYVVSYDQQEQRSLATSVHHKVFEYGRTFSGLLTGLTGGNPSTINKWVLIPLVLVAVLLAVIIRRVTRLGWRRGLSISRRDEEPEQTAIQFYRRLIDVLATQGLKRPNDQTPIEFAIATNSNEALTVTRLYNQVRFGGHRLSGDELREINQALTKLEAVKG